MEYPIEKFRLSAIAKNQIITLKRRTGIDSSIILCRWGFCYSLAEKSPPSPVPVIQDSNLEISWNDFGGEMSDIFLLALKQRCANDGLSIDREVLNQYSILHLHRGISYLAGMQNIKKIEDLIALSTRFSK